MSCSQGIQKAGYLEIKQSSKVRGRKLKTWKRKWVSVHQMVDLSSGTVTARLDVFPDEETTKRSPSDKITFLLENITKVQMAKSKTHPFAFEVVEAEPVLVFSGANDADSFDWITVFKNILWPQREESEKDLFDVSVQPNNHSTRVGLSGLYKMSVKPSGIALHNAQGSQVVQWQLNALKKFYLDSQPKVNQKKVLVIDSGPIAETGEGSFRFLSNDADIILKYIGQCIKTVIAQKQQQRQQQQQQQQMEQTRNRTVSVSRSEYHYRAILENSRTSFIERSESENSSLSSTPPKSPISLPSSPPCTTPMVFPSVPSFQEHDALFRSKEETVSLSERPILESNSPPVTRHSSESALIRRKQQQLVTDMDSKPRTQSFTLVQTPTSLSLRDSGIILQDGDGRPQVERLRRKSSEVRHGSNSFDSAVSTGSYTEEVRVSEAIREEPPPLPTNPPPALPAYHTEVAPSTTSNQQTLFIASPVSPNNTYPDSVTTVTGYPPTVMHVFQNEQQLQSKVVLCPAPFSASPAYPTTTSSPVSPTGTYPNPLPTSPNYPTTTVPSSMNSYQQQCNISSSLTNNMHPNQPPTPPVCSFTEESLPKNNHQREDSVSQSLQSKTSTQAVPGNDSQHLKEQSPFALQFKQGTNYSPRLPPRNLSPVNTIVSENAVPDLPPPRRKTPPTCKHQHSNSEIIITKSPDFDVPISKVDTSISERKPSPTTETQTAPIYHDIDEHSAMGNVDQRVRRHSTGELPKENVYEELKSIGKKDSKVSDSSATEVPPELPIRPATLRYRPKYKDEEDKRRSAFPNLFVSADRLRNTFGDTKEGDCSTDSTGDSTQTLSRSSSKDIYSSIASDLDDDASEKRGHHGHSHAASILKSDSKEASTTNDKTKDNGIIDLFTPSECNWIKSGGQRAPSPVADLMAFDIPNDFTAGVATPTPCVLIPTSSASNTSTVNALSTSTSITTTTASVTDWAIVSGAQATSDASFETFFNERNETQSNWANFDEFDPFSSPPAEKVDLIAVTVADSEHDSTYFNMSAGQPHTQKGDFGYLENTTSNDVTPETDGTANSEHIYASPDDLSANMDVAAASADAAAFGTNEGHIYVTPDDLTAETDVRSVSNIPEHIYVAPDDLKDGLDIVAVNDNAVFLDTKVESIYVAPDSLADSNNVGSFHGGAESVDKTTENIYSAPDDLTWR